MPSHPPQDPLLGTTVAGRYKIHKLLGEGGMGQVYLAEHIAIEKRIALKVLRVEYAHKGEIVTRFQQEAISASRIKHPNVLDVFDFGRLDNGCFYLAMEFLEGCDLADELQRQRALTAPRALPIAMQICRALSAAHAKGVVHRDMKPENIFLQRTADGEEIVKIVDFGIAQLRSNDEAAAAAKPRRLTRTGMIFGTPEYMAPEQAGGKHADPRTDVYACGVILYEMFTGAVPFTGETFLGVLAKHLSDQPPAMRVVYPDLSISPELEQVILRALAKDPALRYQNMNEYAQALVGTPEGQYVGLRGPYGALAQLRGSSAPPPPKVATAQQFVANPSQIAAISANPVGAPPAAAEGTPAPTQAARASTQLVTELETRAPTKPKPRAWIALPLIVVAAAAAGGALFLHRGESEPTQPKVSAAPPAPPGVVAEPPKAPLSAAPVVAPAAASADAPAAVKLSVVTEPAGATLLKGGFQVCDATPCEVLAAANETLELRAQKGALAGKAKVLAQKDQRVTIRLVGAAAVKQKALCQIEGPDGLKIFRECP